MGDRGSPKKVWRTAACAHDFESSPHNRVKGQGCPFCSEGGGFKRGNPGSVYILEKRALRAFKIGITNGGTSRLEHFKGNGWRVLHLEPFADGSHAIAVENAIKLWWKVDLDLPMWLGPKDMIRTSGWTETAHSDELIASDCIAQIFLETSRLRAALAPAS